MPMSVKILSLMRVLDNLQDAIPASVRVELANFARRLEPIGGE
jgi:hypothetical protein